MLDPLAVLAEHPYFAPLGPDALRDVGQRALVRRYEKDALVYLEGEPATGLYLVASGAVRVFKASVEGREQDLFRVTKGGAFNSAPAFDGGPTYANAQATEPSVILLVPREALLELMHRHPEIGRSVAAVLAARLREVAHLAADLSLRGTASRLAGILLRLSDGEPVLTLPTHRDLATMAGTVREVVTRTLRHLESGGVLRLGPRRTITILDRPALERLSGPRWPGVF
jgi:CRP-like cAMP-binding protein